MSVRFLIIAMLFTNLVGATSIDVTDEPCPDAFVGVVISITDPQAPFTTLAKQDVEFEIQDVIRGELTDLVSIKNLKFGPNKFEIGEQYQIELRNGLICSISKL